MITIYIVSFTAALILSLVLTAGVRHVAMRRGWFPAPSSHHIHKHPVPRLGGVAIFASFVTVTALLTVFSAVLQLNLTFQSVVCLLVPGLCVFLLGLYDDVCSAKPSIKFAVQALAATLLFFGGVGRFNLPAILGLPAFEWLALPLTILWVLWITNAFNLIDGLDGLAAGSTVFSMLSLFAVSVISGNEVVPVLAVTLAGATAGFLRFNFNPASIFLGDSGSLFLGFMLSALALIGSQKTPTLVAVAIPVVSFGLPILETALSVVRRFLGGQPLFSADREHIHHKLMERGLTHRQVVIILYGVSALCGLLSLFLLYPKGIVVVVVLAALSLCIWVGLHNLGYHELDELRRAAQRAIEQKQVISNDVAVRRATERLAKAESFLQLCWILQDAFELNDFDGYNLACSTAPVRARNNQEQVFERCFAWHKPIEGEVTDEVLTHSWMLTLELVTSTKKRLGFFTLYRSRSDRPLLIDLNLLNSGFQVALAEALERLIGQATASSERAAQELPRSPEIGLSSAGPEMIAEHAWS